jgi:hypothetical protein
VLFARYGIQRYRVSSKCRGFIKEFDVPKGGGSQQTKWDYSDPTPTRWLLAEFFLELFDVFFGDFGALGAGFGEL